MLTIRETGGFNYDLSVYPNFDNDNLPSAGINFVRFHLCTDSDSQLETFNNKFPLRNYGFAISESSDSGPTGDIAITYAANAVDGPYYSSAGVEQTNGSFEITKSTPFNTYVGEVLWSASQIVEGTFSVTLKNLADENDIIQITDGEFKMIPSM
ncbi:hypothetical protein N7U66_09760 [Lacinutrix neustonica]|uniref:Uncharacterized protein n=1 Tax=Lacinutrix neustonica TaxID=2980107 RepID=A0A9E8SII0_9FLAO|nr:hypothetical protein [Lacinutrix neustonica]WAC03695.1 hypothetical protein N7U66_09760 [Lacinutrix neustonica]